MKSIEMKLYLYRQVLLNGGSMVQGKFVYVDCTTEFGPGTCVFGAGCVTEDVIRSIEATGRYRGRNARVGPFRTVYSASSTPSTGSAAPGRQPG